MEWIADPSIWAGLITLIVIELVLGIDNLVFIAILAEKLPPKQRDRARVTGLLLAMLMRLLLLASISWLVTLTQPLFSFRSFTFSARDLIMLFGGFFLLFKATMELNERLEGKDSNNPTQRKGAKFWGVVTQIVVLDAIFSLDSVITAVGMVDHLLVMMAAVVIAISLMLMASKPLTQFVNSHPTIVILCLSFLLMIGFSLVAEGFGFVIPKGYLYAAIGFSVMIEALNQLAIFNRRRFLSANQTLRQRTTEAVMRLLSGQKEDAELDAETASMLMDHDNQQIFNPQERRMIERVLNLNQRTVSSIMTSRHDIEHIDLNAPEEEIRQLLERNQHTRLVVTDGDDAEDLLGVVHVIDLLQQSLRGEPLNLRVLIRQPLVFPETLPLLPALEQFRNARTHFAFVVDECHRAVTPKTKRELERFFGRSLWYGFTGTPRFAENPYPQMGDLPRTTEELYGKCLHSYTIQNAIHDKAVLGFQVEHNGPKNMTDETDSSQYDNEAHMLKVLDVILNKSYYKLGLQNGKGMTYECMLTTKSIQVAQKYYELLTRVKNGETSLVIDEKIRQVLPDFPKFAITYSVTENEEGSHVNQEKMQKSLNDYNDMFGTKYEMSQIQSYNANLNKRLARKDARFKSRREQLDLVIVVDRLLTGFDAPCMSTIFIDRQPMGPHDLIQAFSRTNRIYDTNKTYGQIVTFQAPKLFKKCVDNAVKLYSAGSTETALLAEWDEVEPAFRKALSALKICAEKPSDIPGMSMKEKKIFAKMFQEFDSLFAQMKSFTKYDDSMLETYGITETEYEDYAGHYKNVMEEIREEKTNDSETAIEETDVDQDYELMAYSSTKIDYEYIINLIQNIVTPTEEDEEITPQERLKKLEEVKQYVAELRKDNEKVADLMSNLIADIEKDDRKYRGKSILNIIENMKRDCVEKVISDFCIQWYASKDDVMYAAIHYRNGKIPNETAIKATVDYTSYKEAQETALPKYKFYNRMMAELKKTLDEEIKPLLMTA